MAGPIGSLGELAGNEVGIILGFGIGVALGRALEPEATALGQSAWSANTVKAVDALVAAAVVAEDVRAQSWGENEAAAQGIDAERFAAIVGEVLNAPGIGELLRMLRRGTIEPADFVHGLRKTKLETRWDGAVEDLQHERLDPAVIATSIQRGIIDDPGLLPVGPPTEAGRVPPMPVAHIDALDEAKASGISRERLAALTRIVGLPPAPGELLQLVNRGVIERTDFDRGVAEGNTRNEWRDALFQLRRRLLTPHEYAELRLRGWIDTPAMHAGAALSGMETADTELLFKMLGRPIIGHQIVTGEARGGTFEGPADQIPLPFLRSLQQSNVRPEWYNLAYANRYTYPSAFVLRSLAQNGELTHDETHQILLDIGWRPDLARKVSARWAGGTKQTADKHVTSAETSLVATLHKSYVVDETDAPTAQQHLTTIAVPAESQTRLLALWDQEREIVRRSLTPAQIKKAFEETKFTRDEALTRLGRLGMNVADAGTLLDE